jgi:hypothetical protein
MVAGRARWRPRYSALRERTAPLTSLTSRLGRRLRLCFNQRIAAQVSGIHADLARPRLQICPRIVSMNAMGAP